MLKRTGKQVRYRPTVVDAVHKRERKLKQNENQKRPELSNFGRKWSCHLANAMESHFTPYQRIVVKNSGWSNFRNIQIANKIIFDKNMTQNCNVDVGYKKRYSLLFSLFFNENVTNCTHGDGIGALVERSGTGALFHVVRSFQWQLLGPSAHTSPQNKLSHGQPFVALGQNSALPQPEIWVFF